MIDDTSQVLKSLCFDDVKCLSSDNFMIANGDDDNGRGKREKVNMRSAEGEAAEGRHQFFNKPLVIKTGAKYFRGRERGKCCIISRY